eukprot:4874546-Pleurochrysis_carterae.AAC.1
MQNAGCGTRAAYSLLNVYSNRIDFTLDVSSLALRFLDSRGIAKSCLHLVKSCHHCVLQGAMYNRRCECRTSLRSSGRPSSIRELHAHHARGAQLWTQGPVCASRQLGFHAREWRETHGCAPRTARAQHRRVGNLSGTLQDAGERKLMRTF